MLSQLIAWGNEHTLCGHWGRILRSLYVGLSHVTFPCADLALHPLVVMNHSHGYNYVLSPLRLLSESSNVDVILKTTVHCRRELTLKHSGSLWPRTIYKEAPALNNL